MKGKYDNSEAVNKRLREIRSKRLKLEGKEKPNNMGALVFGLLSILSTPAILLAVAVCVAASYWIKALTILG